MDKKKSIIITGAASGIGRETALLFGKRGWFVGIFDVNTPLLKVPQKVFCIEKMGVNIEPIQVAETCPSQKAALENRSTDICLDWPVLAYAVS